MNSTYNQVIIEGRLGQDTQVKYFESGSFVVEMSLAVYQGKDKEGNYNPSAWVPVKAWGYEDATNLHKGDKVGITGQFAVDTWNDKTTGKPRQKLYVKVNSKFNDHTLTVIPTEDRQPTHEDAF